MLRRSSLRLQRRWRTNSPEESHDFVLDGRRSTDCADQCDYLMVGALPNSEGERYITNSCSTKASRGSERYDVSTVTGPALPTCESAIAVDGTIEQFSQDSTPKSGIHALQPSRTIAVSLPTELIQHIFTYLGPIDFNAARLTCRDWMDASLHFHLLSTQLKRGGWWSNVSGRHSSRDDKGSTLTLSNYLTRECSLAGRWASDYPISSISRDPVTAKAHSEAIKLADCEGSNEAEQRKDRLCTTSLCGKYLLMASGCDTHAYKFEYDSIHIMSRTSCQKEILALSVTATMDSYSMAILLEGRTGLYINMNYPPSPPSSSPWEISGTMATAGNPGPIMHLDTSDGAGEDVTIGESDELSINAGSIGSNDIVHQSVEIATQRRWTQYFQERRARFHGMRHMPAWSNGVWPDTLDFVERGQGKAVAFKSFPQVVYRNICSAEDPPCSVAISPSRQCVAFGCQGGVELYWVDPTTGQHLNRWFSLTRPTDHLYFLPARRSIDSTIRLRLISTSGIPRTGTEPTTPDAAVEPQKRSWITLTGSWRFPSSVRLVRDGLQTSDHSYAVPLSDGHHILFTDNETGLLSLGGDNPAGAPQRLSRKFVFVPPKCLAEEKGPSLPTVYAIGEDVSKGVRIVAVYGEDVVLYSVPVDAFRYSTAEQEQTLLDVPVSRFADQVSHVSVMKHPTSNAQAIRDSEYDDHSVPSLEQLTTAWAQYLPAGYENVRKLWDEKWPLRISGIHIGSHHSVRALSVQESTAAGLVVWSISATRKAKMWRLEPQQNFYECREDGLT